MEAIRHELELRLHAEPERVWPVIADTERLNRRLGLPPTSARAVGSEPVRVRHVKARMRGIPLEWEEDPFEFVEPRSFWVRRKMLAGPLLEFNGGVTFEPVEGGTRLRVRSEFVPRGAAGRMLVRLLWAKAEQDWRALAAEVDAHLAGKRGPAYGQGVDAAAPAIRRETLERLRSADTVLAREPLAERLFHYVAGAADHELVRMRPLVLARRWEADPGEVLRLFLRAVRPGGILSISWDLLCPNCGGAKGRWARLEDVRSGAHCDDCQITFDANFDRALEVTFRPNPRFRAVEELVFCAGGPRNTPHIVAQTVLAPGEERELEVPLEEGRYRVRNLPADLCATLYAEGSGPEGSGAAECGVVYSEEGLQLSGPGTVRAGEVRLLLANRTGARQQAIVERMAAYTDRVTAARVAVLQEFRDLFGRELLSPGVQLEIRTLPLMFTDLKGSTDLYTSLGDARAYALVRDHFELLQRLVGEHSGGVVKTIGDAVMAAFPTAADAVRCALRIHGELSAFNRSAEHPIRLKIGLHQGPCIATRSYDERLDYFGSTVNVAARTHEESRGSDIVVSDAILRDPDVAGLLEGVAVESYTVSLRGVGETRLHRLTR